MLQVSLGLDALHFSEKVVTPQLNASRQGGEMLCWLCGSLGLLIHAVVRTSMSSRAFSAVNFQWAHKREAAFPDCIPFSLKLFYYEPYIT